MSRPTCTARKRFFPVRTEMRREHAEHKASKLTLKMAKKASAREPSSFSSQQPQMSNTDVSLSVQSTFCSVGCKKEKSVTRGGCYETAEGRYLQTCKGMSAVYNEDDAIYSVNRCHTNSLSQLSMTKYQTPNRQRIVTLRSRTPSLSRPAQHRKMTKAEMDNAMVAKKDLLENIREAPKKRGKQETRAHQKVDTRWQY